MRPLREGHVAQPSLERMAVALRQHEAVAVRRLATQTRHVAVLAQRHRRGVVLAGQVDGGARPHGAARLEAQPGDRRQRATRRRSRSQERVTVGLGHLGQRVDRARRAQPAVTDAQVGRRGGEGGEVALGVVAEVAPRRRRLGARPSRGGHVGHRVLERPGGVRDPHGQVAPASYVVEQDRPPLGRALAGRHVEDQVPGPAGGQGQVDGIHPRVDVEDRDHRVGDGLGQAVEESRPFAADDQSHRGGAHARQARARDLDRLRSLYSSSPAVFSGTRVSLGTALSA